MLLLSDEQRDYLSREFVKQRESGWLRPASVGAPEAILLWGTIGYAALMSRDGRVWIERDWDGDPSVSEASVQETLGALVKAAARHPLFADHVPSRPPNARACEACSGAGSFHLADIRDTDSRIWCGDCEGLGWFIAAAG